MKFYNRNGILYIRVNGKRVSTRLKDTPSNRKLVTSYHKNDEFFNKFSLKTKDIPTICYLCEYVLDLKEKTLKATSFVSYLSIYNSRIKSYFKDTKVNQISKKDMLKYFHTFEDKSTLNIAYTILKFAFEKAEIDEYIISSPMVKKPKFNSTDYEVNPFNLNEINTLLSNCPRIQFRNLLGILFFTGMRPGELFGLRWSDVDFRNFTVSIRRTITNGYIQTPKTKSSLRTIDMISQAETFFLAQRKITGLAEYVFYKPNGGHYKRTAELIDHWKKTIAASKLEYRNIYQTRHSFASNMLCNSEDLNWVSYTLGHKNPKITLDKYTRFINIRRTERKKTFLDDMDTKLTQYS